MSGAGPVDKGPLAGVTVVEIASFISGPFATMMLAQLGATVVKIEPPRGDPFRRFGRPAGGVAAPFASTNRGKASVVLDLKNAADRESLLNRIDGADVLLANWRPAVADRLGLGDELLANRNPRLIRAYLTGFGPSGPLADQPAFDSIIQARSALTDIQSDSVAPAPATTYVADKLSALIACQAVMAAIIARDRTGLGDRVDVSMLDAVSYFNFPDGLANRTFLDHQPVEARNSLAASVRPLRTADGWIMVIAVSGGQIKRACIAAGHAEWIDELRAIEDSTQIVTEFFDRLESVMHTAASSHWLDTFAVHDVPAAPCHTIDEHLVDPQVLHNDLYSIGHTPGAGPTRQIRYPAVFGRYGKLGVAGNSPSAGESAVSPDA
ncbi:CaiB/BaiF CoA transferase family protein [Mycolicibacterium sp.]|uniref:CaiB/BaiF CoA transferase family protein n=1 Tax=Mycolicibacterium sp. TaxID=2320850 RepID=UPI003D149072